MNGPASEGAGKEGADPAPNPRLFSFLEVAVRAPVIRARFEGELVVDNFAGGGGASTGIEAALGRPSDIAINHDPEAIAMHRANHPETRHFLEDITKVDPREACRGRQVGLAWFSPDCTHFSRSKGGKPVDKHVRGLAWMVVRWAKAVKPRVIVLENVEEFQNWGPLLDDDRPDPTKVGWTFRRWLGELSACGYQVEFRTMVAADYGTPTTRKRLYLIARRDHSPLVFPEPNTPKAEWRPASEIIDWSIPCPSIFERERPLAEATQRRIAEGIRRYVLTCAEPFIVRVAHGDIDRHGHRRGRGQHSINDPLGTVCTSLDFGVAVPTLIARSWGERKGQTPRVPGLEKPLGTIVAGGSKHALVAAFLQKTFGGPSALKKQPPGLPLTKPTGTITAKDHHALTTAFLLKLYGSSKAGQQMNLPLPTILAGGGKGGGHLAEVRAFLVKFYKSGGQWQDPRDPLHTVTSKGRFGLVTIRGQDYLIADIGMRMLHPHELFAANGFPEDYDITPWVNGKPLTKTAQIKMVGNSVCPPVAEAIVGANARVA